MTSAAPAARASASFSAVDTVPMTRAPEPGRELGQQQAHAAGRRVHEHRVAGRTG